MSSFFQKLKDDTMSFPVGVKLIVFALFLRNLSWGFIDPYFSMYLDDFADNYSGVGYLISIMNLVAFVAAIPLLRLADRVQDTKIMRDGEILYLLTALFYILGAWTDFIFFLIFGLIFNGVALTLVMVGAEAYIRKHCRKSQESKTFGFYTALSYLGWVIGMVAGAFLVQYYGIRYMFFFLLPSIILGILILRKIHEGGLSSLFSGFRKYFHRRQDLEIIMNDIKNLNRRSVFVLFLSIFDGVIVMFSYIFVPLFALTLDLTMGQVALLMAVMYLPFVFSFMITEATDRMSRMNVIASGLFIGGIAFIGLSFIIQQLWIVVLAAMNSLSLAIIRPAYNGMLTHLTPRRMLGEVSGLSKIAMRVGYVIGPIFTGIIADRFGLQVAFFCIAIFAFSLCALTILLGGFRTLKIND